MGKVIKCVEDNAGDYLFDFRLEKDFSYSKGKNDKTDTLKLRISAEQTAQKKLNQGKP